MPLQPFTMQVRSPCCACGQQRCNCKTFKFEPDLRAAVQNTASFGSSSTRWRKRRIFSTCRTRSSTGPAKYMSGRPTETYTISSSQVSRKSAGAAARRREAVHSSNTASLIRLCVSDNRSEGEAQAGAYWYSWHGQEHFWPLSPVSTAAGHPRRRGPVLGKFHTSAPHLQVLQARLGTKDSHCQCY